MKWLLFLSPLLFFLACKEVKKATPPATVDTLENKISKVGTVVPDRQRTIDSLMRIRLRDSLFSIKVSKRFITDDKGLAFNKLVAATIDTTMVSSKKESFSDTKIYTRDKEGEIYAVRSIYRNKSFTIEVRDKNINEYYPRKLFIDGKELKRGKDLEVLNTRGSCMEGLALDPASFALMKFGNKEYLYMEGYIDRCNGLACGVQYFILYDPVIRKAMLLEQFRSDFIMGYNKETQSPEFVSLKTDEENFFPFYYFKYEGTAYRFTRAGKIVATTDKSGKKVYFSGYRKLGDNNEIDTINILSCHLPASPTCLPANRRNLQL